MTLLPKLSLMLKYDPARVTIEDIVKVVAIGGFGATFFSSSSVPAAAGTPSHCRGREGKDLVGTMEKERATSAWWRQRGHINWRCGRGP